MVSFNPACYIPTAVSNYIPSSIQCAPPPSYFQSLYTTLTAPLSTFSALKTGMDAFLSIPFLSFLLIPSMTSYSTSLNILFFYITWSTLILSHSPLKVEALGSLTVKVLFYIIPSTLFLAFDIIFPSISESFKTLGKTALPIRNLTRAKSPKHIKIIAWSLFNIFLSIIIQASLEYTLTSILGHRSALKVTTNLPLPWAIAKDLLRGLILRDITSYTIHRYLLHASPTSTTTPNSLIRDLTTMHQKWYHTNIRGPFPLSASYDHPLVYILRSFIPTYLPAYIWRFHLLTYILYLTLITVEETFTHSGYSHLPTNFVLGGIARRNDMHCLSGGTGNYGTWGLMDWIMGTSIGGDLAEDLVDEVQEGKVVERVERGVRRGVRGVKGRVTNGRAARGRLSNSSPSSVAAVKSSSGSASGGEKRRTSRRKVTRRRSDSDYEE